jgi:phosphoglycolate phosphatase
MRKKLFIFDLDGTLVDAYPAIIASFNFTMAKLGYPRKTCDRIRKAVGWGDLNLLKPFIRQEDLGRAISIYRKHHAQALVHGVRLMPHAKQLLLCLKKKGFKLAIASNRPTRFTLLILRVLGIRRLFNRVLCGDRLKLGKPHPLILNILVRDLKTAKTDALYVGDMAIDVQTGKRAGIETAAVATGSSSWEELKKARPTYLYRDLEQMKKGCLKP